MNKRPKKKMPAKKAPPAKPASKGDAIAKQMAGENY